MKKYTILFLIFLCLLFNMISVTPVFADTSFKEGVYKATDFNFNTIIVIAISIQRKRIHICRQALKNELMVCLNGKLFHF